MAQWVEQPLEALALNYDTVENHGWYGNLDHTVEQVGEYARPGDVLVDYSGGTGIFAKRLVDRIGTKAVGVVIVDSSPKFLRLSLEKFRDDTRIAFRRIRFVKDERRLEHVDEVLGDALGERGIDGLITTNAIHLYFNLPETVRAWRRALRDSGRLFIQSGNIRNPEMPDDEWIIDETVEVIHREAMALVAEDDTYEEYREAMSDKTHMDSHDELRRKYFLPVRPLEYYLDILRDEGFEVTSVRRRRIPARVDEWYEFLSVYHEGVLGWIGGAEKVTGSAPSEAAVQTRLSLMAKAMARTFQGRDEFGASWTYVTAEPS
jgi:SAM-dependent methyltransferase